MKLKSRLLLSGLLLVAVPFAANADMPGKHPAYLHALSDLRAARWMLEHRPGDAAVSAQEDVAITEIDKAIGEIKKASIDDGKDIHDHPPVQGAQRPSGPPPQGRRAAAARFTATWPAKRTTRSPVACVTAPSGTLTKRCTQPSMRSAT